MNIKNYDKLNNAQRKVIFAWYPNCEELDWQIINYEYLYRHPNAYHELFEVLKIILEK
jgi:hypothetical protein